MALKQQRRKPILHIFPQPILRIAGRFVHGKGLIGKRGRGGRVTFGMLPDDVLIDIFDYYRMDSYYPWVLAHVCRRWRQIIFASPRRLELQFPCTPRTRVRELLDFLPPSMPIVICNSFNPSRPYSTLSLENGSQVIAAIDQRVHVSSIHLEGLTSSLLEKLATMMQETFPTLKYVRLWAGDEIDGIGAPALPDSLFGGSAPLLETFWLRGIPFPEAPKLLLSAGGLAHLLLEKIPDSGYISPEAMVASLSTCTKLETLVIEFLSQYPHPDLTSREVTSLARASLPALTYFCFEGNGGYFDIFVPRIENPLMAALANNAMTVDKLVYYEASYTPVGFSFHHWTNLLVDPMPVEGQA